jgi:hypothetical protein
MRRSLFTLIVLATAVASRGSAQRTRVYLTPFGGAYLPSRQVGQIQLLDTDGNRVTLDSDMQAAAGGGARASVWPREHFGVEASLFYTKSSLRVTDGNVSALFDAEVELASLKAEWQTTNGLSGTDFVLSAGLAGVHHGGQAFRVVGPSTDLGGVAGAALLVTMGAQVRLRLDGEAFAYRYSAGPGLGSRTQLDLAITAGFNVLLSR